MYRSLSIGLFFLIVFFPVQGYPGGEYFEGLVGDDRNQCIHHSSSSDSLTQLDTAASSPLTPERLMVDGLGNHGEEDIRGNGHAPYGIRAFFRSSILLVCSIPRYTVSIIRLIPQQTEDIIRAIPRQTSRLVSSISQQTVHIRQSIYHGIEQCFFLGARSLAIMEARMQGVLEMGRPVVCEVRSFFRSSVLMLRLGHQAVELRVALFVHNTEALSYLTLRQVGFSPNATNRFMKMIKKLVKKEMGKFIGQCFTDELAVTMCSYFLGRPVSIREYVYFLRTLYKSPEKVEEWCKLVFGAQGELR